MTEPARLRAAERRKPGFDRSIRYHKNGLARARATDTCIVEAQGSFRMAKMMPTNAPMPRITRAQSVSALASFPGPDQDPSPPDYRLPRRKVSSHTRSNSGKSLAEGNTGHAPERQVFPVKPSLQEIVDPERGKILFAGKPSHKDSVAHAEGEQQRGAQAQGCSRRGF